MLFRILVSYQLKSTRILYRNISKKIVIGFFGISYSFWSTINECNLGEGAKVRRKEIDQNTSPNSIQAGIRYLWGVNEVGSLFTLYSWYFKIYLPVQPWSFEPQSVIDLSNKRARAPQILAFFQTSSHHPLLGLPVDLLHSSAYFKIILTIEFSSFLSTAMYNAAFV